MAFPDQNFPSIADFATSYAARYEKAIKSVSPSALEEAFQVIEKAYTNRATLYVCGNGGSAAISNHFVCDHLKGAQNDTDLKPKVISLSNNMETITAIANDLSYDEIFRFQLKTIADEGDVLVVVSSSGDSENIVNVAKWARENGLTVIAMTGFSGGRSADYAHVNLHVEADNYGVIEDAHQSLMHIMAQYLRLQRIDQNIITERKF